MRFPQVGERMREAPAHALRAMFAGIGQVLLVADRMRSHPAGPDADQPGADKRQVPPPRPVAAENAAAPAAPPAAEHPRPARPHPASQAGGQLADRAGGPPPQQDKAGSPPPQQEVSRWRSLDETGNVRILPVSRQARPPERPAAAQHITTVEPRTAEWSAATPAPPEPEPDIIRPAAAEPIAAGPAPQEPVPAEPALPEPAGAGPLAAEPALQEPLPAELALPEPAGAGPVLPIANYDDVSFASLRARLRNLDAAQLQALLSYERANAARPAVLGMFERRISKLETGLG